MWTSRTLEASEPARWRQAGLALVCLAALTGCNPVESAEKLYDSKLSLDNPIDWWHQLQGGALADERPPPPGVTDPYPDLGTIPPRPKPTDPATRRALTAQLVGERDRAKQLAAEDPIAWPVPGAPLVPGATPPAPPATAQAKPAQPAAAATPDPDTSTVVLDAANAAPRPPTAAPPPATIHDPTPPAAFTTPLRPLTVTPATGPIPALPTAAPALPNLPGLPTGQPAPVVTRARAAAEFSFAPGSSALPASAEAALKALAARRVTATVAVTAGGEATGISPAAQQQALPLALRRTGAITAALIAAGVPAGSIRAEAVALGRDANARLVN